MNLPAAFRAARSGRDKSAYYRMWHLRQRTGLPRPDERPPWPVLPFEAALLTLGEETGKLEECLRLLADYSAAEDRMVLTVLKRAAYPMTVAAAATVIAPLPLAFSAGTGAYLVAVGTGAVLWMAAGGSLLRSVTGHYLRQPRFVIGRLLRALTFAIESGLPLQRAATLAAEASGDAAVVAHVRRISVRAAATQPLSATFRGCPHVDVTLLAAMEVADVSGDYTGALKTLAALTEATGD